MMGFKTVFETQSVILIGACVAASPGNQRKKFSPTGLVSSLRICRGLRRVSMSLRKAFSQLCA
jgi:hypothetical protein